MSISANIQNYYEKLVCDEVAHQLSSSKTSDDERSDIACVALNSLPPRYICYSVDLNFYTSSIEQQEIQKKVHDAVKKAINFVQKNKR